MRQVCFAFALLAGTAPVATAQVLEVGLEIARGCVGDSSGFCGDEVGRMLAGTGSLWVDERLEVAVRFATLPRPGVKHFVRRDDRFNVSDDPSIRQLPGIDITSTGRSRRFVGGEATYHFARGRAVRPFVGIGLGEMTNRSTLACTPPGCEQLMPTLDAPVGTAAHSIGDYTIIAGISGRIGGRMRVRGGFRLHNFAGEEISTSEVFTGIGYRFGPR